MGSIKGVRRGKYAARLFSGKPVYCDMCHKQYKRKPILAHHMRTKYFHHYVPYPVCSGEFVSVSTCNRHLKNVHRIFDSLQFNLKLQSRASTGASNSIANLSFEANKDFPGMANVLSIQENERFGKHVIADCSIDVGQVVFATPAFATIEYLVAKDLGCFNCGKAWTTNFIKCPHCISVYFCSNECSAAEIHQTKCNQMFNSHDCHVVRMTTELMTKALNINGMVEFCCGVLFSSKSAESYRPPFSQYREVLKLEGKMRVNTCSIAKRATDSFDFVWFGGF